MADMFSGKKVLVFGLGLLGGGVATTNWLLKQGAKVTVTDLKNKKQLAPSLRKIKGKVILALGGHNKKMIREADIIVLNQDVGIHNQFVQYARGLKKEILNEGLIFYARFTKPFLAVTGTRGKTTIVNWIDHFLRGHAHPTTVGNSGDRNPFLEIADQGVRFDIAVAEMPSFQLEYFTKKIRAPDVAIITNLYQDHLNRHRTMREYALAKANIFRHQSPHQHLILNQDNDWTPFFLKRRPKANVWFTSLKRLPKARNGVFYDKRALYFQYDGKTTKVIALRDFAKTHGEHNVANLLAVVLAAYMAGCSWPQIAKRIPTLPAVPFRQEVVFRGKPFGKAQGEQLTIINDTTATSPEGCIAAVKRFTGPHTILIAGGTDRNLDFSQWGKVVPRHIKRKNIILLSGSATDKMLATLRRRNVKVFGTLSEAFRAALEKASRMARAVVLFSPGAKSFELFANEYDRGKKFNALVAKEVRR